MQKHAHSPSPKITSSTGGFEGSGLHLDQLFDRFKRSDDTRAFEQIFYNLFPSLHLNALKVVKCPSVAEEIVDDVFVSLWKNRMKIEIRNSCKAYLHKAVKNKSVDFLRTQHRVHHCSLEHADHIPASQASAQEVLDAEELEIKIDRIVEALPHQCKTIYQLRWNHSLRYKEIADRLNISVKTVDTQINRAMKAIRSGAVRIPEATSQFAS